MPRSCFSGKLVTTMKPAELTYRKLILVCTNERNNGRVCCKDRGGEDLYLAIKKAFAEAAPDIRVSKTGCLGPCLTGATVVVMPDNDWLGDVRVSDVPELVKRYAGEGMDLDKLLEL